MEEVIYEKGREEDELSSFCKSIFDQVNKYNAAHKDQAHVVLLAADSKGGASFCIGDTDKHVQEFMESASKHQVFYDLLVGILNQLK